MNRVLFFVTCVLALPVVSRAQTIVWTKIAQLNHRSAMQFTDSLHGVSAGQGSIFYTTDGGELWNAAAPPYHPPSSTDFYDLAFADSLNGWAVGTLTGADGIIWHSTDGGRSWNEEWSQENRSLLSISAVSTADAFVAGSTLHAEPDTSKVYQTLHAGSSWSESVVAESLAVFSKLFFLDSLHGWMIATARSGARLVLRTASGGTRWDIFPAPASFQTLVFIDSLNGYATAGTAFYATSDAGAHWNLTGAVQGDSTSIQVYALRFLSRLDGWAFGGTPFRGILSEGIARTTDGGSTWNVQSVGLSSNQGGAVSGTMFSDRLGFAVCADGSVLRYSTTTGVLPETAALPSAFRLEQNYPNPFNPTTTIRYDLPRAANVRLSIYNLLGQDVRNLVNEAQEPGLKSVEFNAANLPSGMYFYRLAAGGFMDTKRLVLIR